MIGAEGHLTNSPPIEVRLREKLEDFVVEERPILFPGRETCVLIEKRGLSTHAAVRKLASALHVSKRKITYAGLKDARAVARQWLSVSLPPHRLRDIDLGNLRVLETTKGSVRFGQLEGNHFAIRLRCDTSHQDAIKETLRELERRGVPNFFGYQRFGSRRPNTHLVGYAAIEGDYEKAVDLYVGNPYPKESPQLKKARALYDQGDLKKSLSAFPRSFVYEKNMVKALLQGKTPHQAYKTLPEKMEMLMVGAAQAHVFNQVISWRLPAIDELRVGDLAKTRHRIVTVEDPSKWTEKLKSFDVSPTAPYGSCRFAENEQGELEKRLASPLPRGHRREVRFRIKEINVRTDEGIVVEFTIPKGCYATAVMREVIKWEES